MLCLFFSLQDRRKEGSLGGREEMKDRRGREGGEEGREGRRKKKLCVRKSFSRGFSPPEIEPVSPALAGEFFTNKPLGKPR